jgi:putative phosphoribosyl transferase
MYFHSRAEAGQKLAAELQQFRFENVAVVALSDGAAIVAEQIAMSLHCVLTMLLSENVKIPGERSALGTVSQDGSFVYNPALSGGEVDEYYSEFHGYIEDQKREKLSHLNRLLGQGGLIDAATLREHIIILVSDGFKHGATLDAAAEFFKRIKISKLIVVTPIASVQAVDRMHIIADELHCLSVTDNYISTDHYYDVNDVPSHDDVVVKIDNIVQNWQQ